MGLMALTGRRPAEIFFSASFSLPREKLPYPALLFDGQLKTLIQPLGTSPQIFVSYAWGNISPNATEEDRQRQEVVERLCRTLLERWNLIRDKGALDYGDQISGFMKTLGQARLVIVVLSEKYLRSPYCMTELYCCTPSTKTPGRKGRNSLTASFRWCSRTPTLAPGAIASPTQNIGRLSSKPWSNTLPTLE
jgi:TIR domain-containing protein/telomere resolvase